MVGHFLALQGCRLHPGHQVVDSLDCGSTLGHLPCIDPIGFMFPYHPYTVVTPLSVLLVHLSWERHNIQVPHRLECQDD